MPREQIEHGCRPLSYSWRSSGSGAPDLIGSCHVSTSRALLVVRDGSWDEPPTIYLWVSTARQDVWLDRIAEWFALIAAAEDGPPADYALPYAYAGIARADMSPGLGADQSPPLTSSTGQLDQLAAAGPAVEAPSLCAGCGEPMHAAVITGGFATHPNCDAA